MIQEPISLIFNPAAGRVRRDPQIINRARRALEAAGMKIRPKPTQGPGDATRLAREAVEDGAEMVIVCGGDGTINEAVQGLVGSETALAVWPGGTANVLARELGLPRSTADLTGIIARRERRVVSVGRAFSPQRDWQRYFLLMAGIGLDASIVRDVRPRWKRLSGYGAFWASGLSFLARLPLTPFSVEVAGEIFDATFACIANAPGYGGGFRIAPQADLSANELDVCVVDSRTRRGLLAHALLGLAGRHLHSPSVVYRKTQSAIGNSNPEAPVQLDGEFVGTLPMRFESVPDALYIIGNEEERGSRGNKTRNSRN